MIRRRFLTAAALLAGLILLTAGWRDVSGNTINPRYVGKIKDGVTTKNEIMLLFGEPQEVQRQDNMLVFFYRSYKDATPPSMRPPEDREVTEQSTHPFFLDQDKNIKTVKKDKKPTVLKSSLIVRFQPDGYTVLSHDYQEAKEAAPQAPRR